MTQVPIQHAARLEAMEGRARTIAEAGGLDAALRRGALANPIDTTLAEGLVLGLLKQGVRKYLAVFGHGSTDLAEVLRVYEAAGLTRTFNFRHETAMAHAATALKWLYGETAAVVTSIGPGALQAFAGSLAAASNGIGVYHIYGDETTHGEGPNMQAIPKHVQSLFGQLTALMGESYVLHTPEALRAALRRGSLAVHRSFRAGPFFLLLPLNTQPARIARLNLEALPGPLAPPPMAVGDPTAVAEAEAMMGYAEMLGERALNHPDLDELDLRAIQTIQRQTERLNRMIETLLDVSRIRAVHTGERRAWRALRGLVHGVEGELARVAVRAPDHEPDRLDHPPPRRGNLRPRSALPAAGIPDLLGLGAVDRPAPRRHPQHHRPLHDADGRAVLGCSNHTVEAARPRAALSPAPQGRQNLATCPPFLRPFHPYSGLCQHPSASRRDSVWAEIRVPSRIRSPLRSTRVRR